MVVTYEMVKFRLGDIEANLGTGSANIISQAISGASAEIDALTNTATGDVIDHAKAYLAAGLVVDTFLGRDDITVSNERLQMAKNLKENAYNMIKSKGINIKISKVNA